MANQKNAEFFDCELCDFKCCKKSNYTKHLSTRKHLRLISLVGKNAENADFNVFIHECSTCNKKYKHLSSLSKHKKNCNGSKIVNSNYFEKNSEKTNKIETILLDVLNENKKLQKVVSQQKDQIDNLIPSISNSKVENNTHIDKQINNQFNFQIFLDTECKNAMNLKDFVDSLKIKLEDLDVLKDKGLLESVAGVLVNGLKELELTRRPIHCSDLSENRLYIKNKDVWKEDENCTNMNDTINTVVNKNRKAIKDWEAAHPNYMDDDKLMSEYLIMVQEVMKPINENNVIIQKVSEVNDSTQTIV
jgi:hypothetical protein